MKYRPWGKLDWLLTLSDKKDWYFVGTLGTEERSLCSWSLMKTEELIHGEYFFVVQDHPSHYLDTIDIMMKERIQGYKDLGGNSAIIEHYELMSELFTIQKLAASFSQYESIVLDITSMPKRFFFILLKQLIKSNTVKNLIITYSAPESYTSEPLYEDIDTWRNLPGFGGTGEKRESLIISIGFLVESLNSYISDNPDSGEIKMFIPFPAPLAALKRTWKSISLIERDNDSRRFEKYRVDTFDTSSAFDQILNLASNTEDSIAFAPFGPKPISVAMCLYAIQKECSVYYPQPKIYNPKYSMGIKNNDPIQAISAYWIKHNGENLYQI